MSSSFYTYLRFILRKNTVGDVAENNTYKRSLDSESVLSTFILRSLTIKVILKTLTGDLIINCASVLHALNDEYLLSYLWAWVHKQNNSVGNGDNTGRIYIVYADARSSGFCKS